MKKLFIILSLFLYLTTYSQVFSTSIGTDYNISTYRDDDYTAFIKMNTTGQSLEDSSFMKYMVPSINFSNSWMYLIENDLIYSDAYDPSTTVPIYKEVKLNSRLFNRSYVFYTVFESKTAMAHWTKVNLTTSLLLQVDPAPIHPGMTINADRLSNATTDESNVFINYSGPVNWWKVPINLTDNSYPPYSYPTRGALMSDQTPTNNTAGWNIRMWFYATNQENLANIDWLEYFSQQYYVDKFNGTDLSPSTDTGENVLIQKKIIPSADVNLLTDFGVGKNYGTLTLSPNSTEGVTAPFIESDNGNSLNTTYSLTYDKQSTNFPKNLYGRYLIILFQVYPYDRFKSSSEGIRDHFTIPAINLDYSGLKYDLPTTLEYIKGVNPTESIVNDNSLVNGGDTCAPLTVVPVIQSIDVNYNFVNFDIIINNKDGGLEYSLDNKTQYYQWRAIEDFPSGQFDNGSITKQKPNNNTY